MHVSGHGVEAAFVVPSALLALDLALRACQAGISWRASTSTPQVRALTLSTLRDLAHRQAAQDPRWFAYHADILGAEDRAAAARLN